MPDRKLNTVYICTLKIKHEQSIIFTFKKWYEYKSKINVFQDLRAEKVNFSFGKIKFLFTFRASASNLDSSGYYPRH